MPNWKKIVVSGSDALLNSVTASFTGSLTGALTGTASWATNAVNALTATTASVVRNQRVTTNANYYFTAVDSLNSTITEEFLYSPTGITYNPTQGSLTTTSVTASFTGSLTGALTGTASWASSASNALSSSRATSSSYALTASYALNGGGGAAFPYTGAATITGSLIVSGSGGTNTSLNTTTGVLKDAVGIDSISWQSRYLYDSTGNASTVDYGNGVLYDLSGIDSIQWINRTAFDSGGNPSIDWGSRILYTPSAVIALNFGTLTDDIITSELYSSNIIASVTQRNLARNALYAGQIIEGTIDVGVSPYDIMYLDTDGTWKALKNLPTVSTKMLGIEVAGNILIDGDMTVSDDGSEGTYVVSEDHGLPVYLSGTTGQLTTVPPTVDVIRIVGHIYYQDPTFTNVWLMKFRPSNEWYEI